MGKSTRRSAAIIVAGLAAVCSISVATTAGASTPPAAPDDSEVVSSEPNAAAVAFELAPYIREHVEPGRDAQVRVHHERPVEPVHRRPTRRGRAGDRPARRRRRPPGPAHRSGRGPARRHPGADRPEGGRRHRRRRRQRRLAQAGHPAGLRCRHPLDLGFTDQPDSMQLAFVGEDNRAFGEYEGQLLAEELEGQSGPVVASRSTPPPDGRPHAWKGSRPAWPPTLVSSSSARSTPGSSRARCSTRSRTRCRPTPMRSRSPRSTAAASSAPPSGPSRPTGRATS